MGMGIERSITHWTGGGGRASQKDKEHYHKITEHDGNIVDGHEEIQDNIVTGDGDYAAHTLRMNTASGGFAMAGMHKAKETPFDPGPSPINPRQFEAHCKMLAEFHLEYAIPVTRKTCLTHAEVESTLGVRQNGKWDLTRLVFRPDLLGSLAVGDYLRERVKAHMPMVLPAVGNRPLLRSGDHGPFVMELQELLKRVKFFAGKVDGHFGPITKASVQGFQGHAMLPADGLVGPMTWEALMVANPRPERDVSADDLRKSGSRTIADADRGEAATKAGAGAVLGLGTVDVAIDATQKLTGASDSLSAAQSVIVDNWLILIMIVIGIVGYRYGPKLMAQIRDYRVEDAREGANLKR